MTQTAALKDKLATTNGNGSQAVAKAGPKDTATTVQDMLAASWKTIQSTIPKHVSPERLARIAVTTIRTTPALMRCNAASLVGAILQAVRLGLEPNIDGQCYIIPYGSEAQFQIGYKGMVQLMYQSGMVGSVTVTEVCENDDYDFGYGPESTPYLRKAPKERGETVGYFGYVKLTNGGYIWDYMTVTEAHEHAKKFSKSGWKNGALAGTWKDHFDAMAMKTVILRLSKLAPKSVEIREAMRADATVTHGADMNAAMRIEDVGVTDAADEAPAEVIDETTGEVTTSGAIEFPEILS